MKTTIKLSDHEAIAITRTAAGVDLEVIAFRLSLARRSLTLAQAREIGDALGFASNDPAPAAPPKGCTHNCDQGRRCTCGALG